MIISRRFFGTSLALKQAAGGAAATSQAPKKVYIIFRTVFC